MTTIDRLNKNINDYRRDTLEIEHFLIGTIASYDFFKKRYPEILKEFETKKNREEEKLEIEIYKNLNQRISTYESDVHTVTFINLIARAEAFLNDILETLYLWQKRSLITDKSISYKEVIDCENIDDLVKKIRENSILEFSHSSFKDKLDFFKKKFKLKFKLLEKHIPGIIELFTTRNIILHNNGIVNKTYLNINKNSSFKLGTKRIIDTEYLRLTFVLLTMIARVIEEQIKEKIGDAAAN